MVKLLPRVIARLLAYSSPTLDENEEDPWADKTAEISFGSGVGESPAAKKLVSFFSFQKCLHINPFHPETTLWKIKKINYTFN